MIFRLDTPEGIEAARSWDFFVDGERSAQDPRRLTAPVLRGDLDERESLISTRTFGYHEEQVRSHGVITTEEIDSYRCWPDAGAQPELEFAMARDGGTKIPLVIYCDGKRAVLGDGNHRLAAAKRIGLRHLPVFVAPDRLELPRGMTHEHLAPIGVTLRHLYDAVIGVHDYHPERRRLVEGGVAHVWCSCGASWKRAA